MKKNIVQAGVVLLAFMGLAGFVWADYNTYEPVKKTVVLELGEQPSDKAEDYIKSGNPTAIKKTKLDMSKVNTSVADIYPVKAVFEDKVATFNIKIKDSVMPEITLAEDIETYKTVIGKEIPSKDLVESVYDLSGIKSVSFTEKNQKNIENTSDNPLDKILLVFDTVGEQKITVFVTDANGNTAEQEIMVKVVEDYLAHVSGFKDITCTVGNQVDFMSGISFDKKVKSVTPDASNVKLGKVGTYKLTYSVLGDDGETTAIREVKVTVNPEYVANNSGSYGNTGNLRTNGKTSGYRASSSSGKKGSSSKGSGSKQNKWEINETWSGTTESGVHATTGEFTFEHGAFD